MRRALVLIPVILVSLLAASPTVRAGEPSILKPEFTLHADGFLVRLKAETDSAHVVLTLFHHGQTAYYETAAQISEDSVKARFGRFGELDYTFTPGPGGRPKCEGGDGTSEGTFRGTFDFTGENGYVKFEAGHAHGSFEAFPTAGCEEPDPTPASPKFTPAPRGRSKGGDEVTLVASRGDKRRTDYFLAFTGDTKKGRRLLLNGFRAEKREGMLVERGVQVVTGAGDLKWDRAAGIARLTPPVPFQGKAEFRRRPHGKSIWRGSLRVPLLGGRPIHLVGGRFKASLGAGSILD